MSKDKNITTDRDIILREKHDALKGIDNLKEQVKQLQEELDISHAQLGRVIIQRDQLKSKIEELEKQIMSMGCEGKK